RLDDLEPREPRERDPGIELVLADLPASPDDAAHGIVQPRRGAADLDFLSAREPEAGSDQAVLEHDEQVLELLVEEGGAREAERHANDLPIVPIEIHRADHAGQAIVLWPDLDLVYVEHPSRDGDAERVADRDDTGCRSGAGSCRGARRSLAC